MHSTQTRGMCRWSELGKICSTYLFFPRPKKDLDHCRKKYQIKLHKIFCAVSRRTLQLCDKNTQELRVQMSHFKRGYVIHTQMYLSRSFRLETCWCSQFQHIIYKIWHPLWMLTMVGRCHRIIEFVQSLCFSLLCLWTTFGVILWYLVITIIQVSR